MPIVLRITHVSSRRTENGLKELEMSRVCRIHGLEGFGSRLSVRCWGLNFRWRCRFGFSLLKV